MPVDRHLQATLASGEFDPLLASREDVAFYYSSAKRIENAIVLPQAGAKRREGFKRIGLQRGALSYHDTFSFGAPNGGTANNVNDPFGGATSLETTTGISTTTEYVIATIDTISVERISVVDLAVRVTGLPSGATSCTIALQSSEIGRAHV